MHLRTVFAVLSLVFTHAACDDSKPTGVKPEPGKAATTDTTASAKAVGSAAPSSAAAPSSSSSGSSGAAPSAPSATPPTPAPSASAAANLPDTANTKPKRRRRSRSSFFRKSSKTAAASATATATATGTALVVPTAPTAQPTSAPAPKPAATIQLDTPAPGSADFVAAQVDAVYLPIVRFRARFKQRYKAKVAGTTKVSSGVCYVQRPGKISFSYHEPNKNRVVSDGVTLKVYEHENKQMFLRPVANTEYPGALAFIMGKGLRQSFKFSFHKKSKWEGGPVLVGKPRVANPAYKKVLFYIDKELLAKSDSACVRRVLVLDAQRNQNRFDFLHIEQPTKISPSIFSFEAPPGTNIIK